MSDSTPPVIPTAFRRFDTRVSSDDQFLNARDLLYARQNFNAIYARRARWPLFSTTFTGAVTEFGYNLAIVGTFGSQINMLHQQAVRIPYYAPSVQIVVYGAVDTTSETAYLYPYMQYGSEYAEIQLASGVQHTNGTGLEKVQMQIDIPDAIRNQPTHQMGYINAVLGVAAEVHLDGADLGDPETVIDAGYNWVVTNEAVPQFSAGDFIYVTSQISATLRRVVSATAITDGSRYVVNPAWAYRPITDDTLNGQTLVRYKPDTITAWADRATVAE